MKKIDVLFTALVLFIVSFGFVPAFADSHESPEPCVPSEAWTEVIEHPEVTEEVYHEAVTIEHPAVPAVTEDVDTWYSYNPSVDVDGDVSTGYPVGDKDADKDNGWQVNNGNHTGQYADPNFAIGVPWQEGNGRGSWFFVSRVTVVVEEEIPAWTEIVEEAWTETVVVTEAWTETIEHEAVVCPPEDTVALTPAPPTFTDPCGTSNDTWAWPEDDQKEIGYREVEGGVEAYDFNLDDDYVIDSGAQTFWAFADYFTNKPCPTEPKTTTPEWTHKVQCPSSVVDVVESDTYTYEISGGRWVTITFTAADGYVFEAGDEYEVSEDGLTATAQEFIVTPRCPATDPPDEPEPPLTKDPKGPKNPESPREPRDAPVAVPTAVDAGI